MEFKVLSKDSHSAARRCEITLPHGKAQTPMFMPVGTAATVKSIGPDDLTAMGSQVILANAYHCYLRPGVEIIREAGGLHGFMAWNGPVLTDSGGFQVFSLGDTRTIDDDGVTFKSPIDGAEHRFTPETSMDVQIGLGADIIMAFDECPPWPCTHEENEQAVNRTTAWARRCLDHFQTHGDPAKQSLFGIIQGGGSPELRRRSAAELVQLGFPGYAIGGLSVGEPIINKRSYSQFHF